MSKHTGKEKRMPRVKYKSSIHTMLDEKTYPIAIPSKTNIKRRKSTQDFMPGSFGGFEGW